MDNDEQAVRGDLKWLATKSFGFGHDVAHKALALLDAKDAKLAECRQAASVVDRALDTYKRERDEARAKLAATQAAMVEAVDNADWWGEEEINKAFTPFLPKPAPDPLVEALQQAAGTSFGDTSWEVFSKHLTTHLAARGLHITEKKP